MALSVTHTLQTAIADDPSFDVSSSEWNAAHSMTGTLAVASGGTDIASYAVGDLLYASAATTLAKLAGVATGNALVSGGVTTAPAWGKVGLTTHITGTLPVGNGGTNITTYAVGDLLYASAAGVLSKLADVATGNALISGGVGVAPAWGKVNLAAGGHVTGTLPVGNGGTGVTAAAALTKTDDTNVTLTLGGTPTTALLTATSITAGWSGTLSIARGGTAAATAAAALTSLGAVAKAGDTMTNTLYIAHPTIGSYFNLDPVTAAQQAIVNFNQSGVGKWQVGKQTDNAFIFYDVAAGNYLMSAPSGGTTVTFGKSVLLAGAPTVDSGAATKAYVDTGHNATSAEYLSNSAPTKKLNSGAVWTAAAPVTVTPSGSTFTPNMAAGIDFQINLASATNTVANPTTGKAGQKGIIYISQDATGSRLISTWGNLFYWPGGIKPTLSTAANAIDIVSYVFNGSAYFCTHSAGFAP